MLSSGKSLTKENFQGSTTNKLKESPALLVGSVKGREAINRTVPPAAARTPRGRAINRSAMFNSSLLIFVSWAHPFEPKNPIKNEISTSKKIDLPNPFIRIPPLITISMTF
jgi:hypothetical protein